jgi:hypothetical protein
VGGKTPTICSMQIYKEWQHTPTNCTAMIEKYKHRAENKMACGLEKLQVKPN